MNIKNVVHHNGILHDDLLKDNIMLHFMFNNPYVLYIDMCSWGEIRCLQEVIPSLYDFSKEQDANNMKKMSNFLWCVAKQQQTTLRSKTYLGGSLQMSYGVKTRMQITSWTIQ
jgi:hypothetical protein